VPVERLSEEDARILAREVGEVRGHICKVLVVDGEHSVDALRRHVRARLGAVPRLCDCLVEAPLGIAPPAWLPYADFDLDRHVRDGGRARDHAQLERAVAALMETRLDRDHPLWAIDLIALDGGRSALVLRLHHCMADGATAIRIVRNLLLDGDDAAPAPEPGDEAPAPEPPGGPTRAALLVDALRWRTAWIVRRGRPHGEARGSHAQGRSKRLAVIRRELAPRERPSPLAQRVGPRRVAAFSSYPLDDIKAIGHGAPEHATVNDVVLAAVAGGLRRWLTHTGGKPHELAVKVPVSLHQPDETGVANRDSFIVVHVPLDEPDPLARLLAIAAETRERKAAHDADELAAFLNDLGRMSKSLEQLAERWTMSPRVFALNVSNVPGPQGERTVMGSRLLEMHTLAEIAERHVLRVAVVSAVGRLSFGLCADADALERLGLVADGIADELRALRRALATA
jgi:diacylglycerol O-acyltransferase